jgi:hypothetical protein
MKQQMNLVNIQLHKLISTVFFVCLSNYNVDHNRCSHFPFTHILGIEEKSHYPKNEKAKLISYVIINSNNYAVCLTVQRITAILNL